ncbi:pyruvate dehydrogenase complex dehydrogenase (E1) component [Dietzia sp. 2505]
MADLGEVVWVVDMNRQSLDRVVPNIAARRLEKMFAAAGWQVLTVPFGRTLEGLFARPGGQALQRRIRDMSKPEYQRLLRCSAQEIRDRIPGTGPEAEAINETIGHLDDQALIGAISNLGGHDIDALRDAYARGVGGRADCGHRRGRRRLGLLMRATRDSASSVRSDLQIRRCT